MRTYHFWVLTLVAGCLSSCGNREIYQTSMMGTLLVHEDGFHLPGHQKEFGIFGQTQSLPPGTHSGSVTLSKASKKAGADQLSLQIENPIGMQSQPILWSDISIPAKTNWVDLIQNPGKELRISSKKNGTDYDLRGVWETQTEHPQKVISEIEDCSINMLPEHGLHPKYEIEFGRTHASRRVRMVEYTLETKHQTVTIEFLEKERAVATLKVDRPVYTKHYSFFTDCDHYPMKELYEFNKKNPQERSRLKDH